MWPCFVTSSFIFLHQVRVPFFGKAEAGFLNPKIDFVFVFTKIQKRIMNPKNPHPELILQIKSKSRFLGFMIHANLLVSPYFLSIFHDKTFDCRKENSGDYSVQLG